MLIDKQTEFSSAQAITADAASTNVYDTGTTQDVGIGTALKLYMRIKAAFNTLTSLNVSLQTSTDEAFTSPITLWTQNYLLAVLTLNAAFVLPGVPAGAKRYLRLYYDVVGTDPTTGKITAGIVLSNQQWKAVPNGI